MVSIAKRRFVDPSTLSVTSDCMFSVDATFSSDVKEVNSPSNGLEILYAPCEALALTAKLPKLFRLSEVVRLLYPSSL